MGFALRFALGIGSISLGLACEARSPSPNVEAARAPSSATAEVVPPAPAPSATPAPEALRPSAECRAPSPVAKCASGFCEIGAGCFVMGAPRNEFGAARYANRQVEVRLTRSFLLAKTELTRREWQAEGLTLPAVSAAAPTAKPCAGDDCPVSGVGFFDAVAFANHYSKRRKLPACYELRDCKGELGRGLVCGGVKSADANLLDCKGYRLPTEAEWEYAARAGGAEAFYSGPITPRPDTACQSEANLESIAWYCHNSENSAHAVGQKAPNAWGLHDVLGNVFEWCNDLKAANGYGDGPLLDPLSIGSTARDLSPAGQRLYRIVRGGAFLSAPVAATVSHRAALPDDTASENTGLRLAKTAR